MAKIISKIKTSNNEYGIRAGYMYYGLTTGTESALTVTITDESGNTISIPELVKGMTFALTLHVIPSTSATLSVNGLTGKPIQYGTGLTGKEWVVGETYQFVYNGTAYVAMSTYDDYTVTTSGSGNAITSISKSGKTITATKGSTFLTAHPTITKSTDTTSTQSVAHQGSFTVIDSVTRDSNGHVTKVNTKTVTLPSDVGEVNQNAFSKVTIGTTTIEADTKTDTLTLVAGSNITLTPDATNDKITIAATDTNTHYQSLNIIGAKSATTNSVQGNGSVYLNHIEDGKTVTSSHLIKGDGGTKVTSDASGNITISSATLATVATSGSYNDLSSKPTSLKNPYSLTIQGNGTNIATYDGSSAVTANIPAASTSAYGVTKLSSATNSTSTTLAATASAVKAAYDLANGKASTSVATTSANGLMSSTDKSKLDGIASGATANTGTVTSIATGSGLTGGTITSSGTISHADTSTLSGSYGPTANVTGAQGATIVVPQITVDGFGHVTAVTNRTYTSVNTDTDTHYKSLNIIGAKSATTNSVQGNGSVYLNHVENGAVTSKHKITGSGGTSVVSDENGNITISSPSTVEGAQGYQGYRGYQGYAGTNGTTISGHKQTTTSTADGGKNIYTINYSDGTSSTMTLYNGNKGTQGYQGYKGDAGTNAMTYNNKTTACYSGYTWTITGATRTYSAFNCSGAVTISGTPTQGVEHYLLIHNCSGAQATITFATSLGNLVGKSNSIVLPIDGYVEVGVVYLSSASFTGSAKATLILTFSDILSQVN